MAVHAIPRSEVIVGISVKLNLVSFTLLISCLNDSCFMLFLAIEVIKLVLV